MKKLITAAFLATGLMSFAASADEAAERTAADRLSELEEMVITAEKEQPRAHKPDEKVAALLAEVDAETGKKTDTK